MKAAFTTLLGLALVFSVALVAQGALLKLAGVPWIGRGPRGLLFMTLQPAAWLLGAMLTHRAAARNPKLAYAARAYLFVGVVEMVTLATVAFPYAQYGAVMVLTIVLAGLFISREYVMAWTLAASCGWSGAGCSQWQASTTPSAASEPCTRSASTSSSTQ